MHSKTQRLVFSAAFAASLGLAAAQTVQITGHILERAAMTAVPGATVQFSGTNLSTTTDSTGYFSLSGNPVSVLPRQLEWKGALIERGMLRVHTLSANVVVEATLYDARGKRVSTSAHRLGGAGSYDLPVLQNAPRNSVGFLKIRAGEETYRFRVFNGDGASTASRVEVLPGERNGLGKAAAAGDSVTVTISGLNTKVVSAPSNGDLGNIVMDYPARPMTGLGMAPPYGATMLFDGSQGAAAATAQVNANFHEWWRFSTGGGPKPQYPISFKLAHDPQYMNDTVNHVTLQMCCENTTNRWGYSDIQENVKRGDVQIHAEWIQMGRPSSMSDSIDNPDSTTQCTSATTQGITTANGGCWNNSGVYVQSRFEIQIQSNALTPTTIVNCHEMGSVVNEYAPAAITGNGTGNNCTTGSGTCTGIHCTNGTPIPSPCPGCGTSNQNKKNGVWQSYDIVFRSARWKSTTTTRTGVGDTNAVLTAWWNGVLTHVNRKLTGIAAGTSNHSGEEMNDTLYGLKLQDELGDVRFRNVWIKNLKIDSLGTNFFY